MRLGGWKRQQDSRYLREQTITPRLRTVRRFARTRTRERSNLPPGPRHLRPAVSCQDLPSSPRA